ncbi:MAG: hypothetical protein L6Q38_10685, partial [Nitrospira sp.]|nr:hypothetical protein [Nitrospira sp.]
WKLMLTWCAAVIMLTACIAAIGLQRDPRRTSDRPFSGASSMPAKTEIEIHCRLLKARDLFSALGLPMSQAAPDRIYIVGEVRNPGGRTAYARIRFTVRGNNFSGKSEVNVGMIPPNGKHSEPFLCKVGNFVHEGDDVQTFSLETQVLEVKYK